MATKETKKVQGIEKEKTETENKKVSRFAQYLKTEYRKGTITNMRAVLK